MRGTSGSGAWGHAARIAVPAAAMLVLAGCMADYAYVQPNVAGSGGYYTSDGPYSSRTSLYYGTGSYGYYGGYDGYEDWPGSSFGFSDPWDFPGYWGPWYSIGVPVRGCWDGCRHGWRHHDHHWQHGEHDPVATSSPRPWLKHDRPRVPPGVRDAEPSTRMPVPPVDRFANRRPPPSARFAPRDFARAPDSRMTGDRFDVPVRPVSRVPAEPDFTSRRMPLPSMSAPPMSVRAGFANQGSMAPVARPEFRAAPAAAPIRSAPPGSATVRKVEIP